MKPFLSITIVIAVFTILAACGGTSPTPLAAAPDRLASASTSPGTDANSDLFWLEKTQVAVQTSQAVIHEQIQLAQLSVTNTAVRATMSAQSTQDAVHLTQVALDLHLTADAATAAAAWTATQVNQNLTAAQTATAVAGANATEVKSVTATAQWYADQERARIEQRAQKTETFRTWGPVVGLVLLSVILLFSLWRWGQIQEAKSRIIEQPGGKHLIITNQKRSLTEHLASNPEHLPTLLRFLAWLIETNTVLVDPERNVHPVTIIQGGSAISPPQTTPDIQERTTARNQQVQLAHELAPTNAAIANAVATALVTARSGLSNGNMPTLPAATSIPGHSTIVDGQFDVIPVDAIKPFIEEARVNLLNSGSAKD